MANKKITSFTELTSVAAGDFLPIVDVSDTTDASTGTTKKITQANLTAGFVTTSSVDVLTNKTLTAATITTSLVPTTNDGAPLGNTTNQFSDLFLAEGGVINWDNGDATMTQTSNDITFAGITTFSVGTSTALTAGTIEIGGVTDTTINRNAAGVIGVEGVAVPTVSSTHTLTNKRVQPRILSAASYTTDTGTSLNIDNCDIFIVTAQAGALLFNAPGGTLAQGEKLIIRIKDNGTARALTWNAVFRALGVALPSTTVLSKTLYLGFFYNLTDTKWDLVASAQEA